MKAIVRAGVTAVALLLPAVASAQFIWRPDAEWRTLETGHFIVHYPREFERWTLDMAEQLESVRSAVGREVGSVPAKRVTVMVTDPMAVANGSAWPYMDAPAIVLWPTPPDPRSAIGNSRGWAELLAVHEFAHLAHLTRPSRNPRQRLMMRLTSLGLSPVLVRSPRWVIEGYATYVEGRLTGSGRPHGAWRPAVLRQWALEGRLPGYGELNGYDEYNGRAFAYLGGSAFLEWLADRRGDSTIAHLWRRLSARRQRSFNAAFAGVYGDSPRDLYGRFTAELTGRALEIERTLRDSGLVEGTLVQRLAWSTGDPAISPDGERVALVLRDRERPSRVVVWRIADEPPDTGAARRRERERRRDPEDVPDVEFHPRPKTAVATLRAKAGIGFDSPRFLPDGEQLLVTRFAPRGDGSRVPDLYVWNTRSGALRRVTRGANLRAADPSPDGQRAAAIRCLGGLCSLVEVSLASGAVEELAAATPLRAYARPRYAPDGRSIFVSRSDSGRWQVARWTRGSGAHVVAPASFNRYDAQPTADGGRLLHVSEEGGIPNLTLLHLESGRVRTLTRVTGAAVAPAQADDQVYFLSLHADGWDLRRIPLDSATTAARIVVIDPRLAPAATVPVARADTFARAALPASRPYGVGPREYRALYAYALGADGRDGVIALASTDKVGRLTWLAQGAYGSAWRPRGGALSVAWRATVPALEGDLFALSRDASRQKPAGFTTPADDHDLLGATISARTGGDWIAASIDTRLGAAYQRLRVAGASAPRYLGFGELRAGLRQQGEKRFASQQLGLRVARGESPDPARGARTFTRALASLAVAVGESDRGLRVEGLAGYTNADAAHFEQFAVGGTSPAFADDATLTQWVAMPVLPFGALRSNRIASYRLAVGSSTLSPYYWAGSAGAGFDDWMRVVGAEGRAAVPTLPLLRLPAAEATAGVGYSLDEPWRKRLRAYLTLRYRP